ncbi:MAG: hypothetical protein GDA49_03665 [Rhodospirillales bacterium]|nr:hypothetical protein [Rhodospirillales bacterium]
MPKSDLCERLESDGALVDDWIAYTSGHKGKSAAYERMELLVREQSWVALGPSAQPPNAQTMCAFLPVLTSGLLKTCSIIMEST